ncbi:MAG TPA: TonB-dependent siderophore receptor [Burkholderiaceae bacterium]|nr:TonB-dependent siderophore receptor [Burkholderiaceae bacterium]
MHICLPRHAWNADLPVAAHACRKLLAAACLGASALLPALAMEPAIETVLPVVTVKAAAPDATTEGSGAYTTGSSQGATRLKLSPRETPQSVSVITRTQLDDFGLRSANDALAGSTGVTVERVETDRTYFTARGFDIMNFQLDGLGLPFATGDQLGDIDTAVYDRVEVLRGANGLLSSTGNPSATINFVRKRPTAQAQASAALTLGSWNQRRVDADLAGPLNAEGSVRARLVAATQKGDSYLDRYALEKNLVYGVVEIDMAPDLRFTVGHLQQHNLPNSPLWGGLTLLDGNGDRLAYERSASTAADWAYWNTEDVQTFAELSRDLGHGWNAKAVLTRRELGSDGEMLYIYDGVDAGTKVQTFFSYPSKYSHREVQSLFDLYATGPFTLGGRRHELVVGLNASRSLNALRSIYADVGVPLTLDQVLAGSLAQPAFGSTIGGLADFVDERRTLYSSARVNLADDLKLIGGLNLTQVHSDGEQYGEVHRYDLSKGTPYLGVVKDLDAQHSLYANYARIFNPQYKLDMHDAIVPPVQGSNLELGAKAEWLRKKLQGSVAVFRTEQNNTAEAAGLLGGQTRYKPIDARSTGIELELVGSLAPNWQLQAGYTQLRLTGSDGQDVRRFVPRKTLRVSTTYKPAAMPGLSVGGQARWQDEVSGSTVPPAVQPAYTVLDLMVRYEVNPQLSLTANLNNVTDATYLTSLQWPQGYYGAPRHGSVTLNWTF